MVSQQLRKLRALLQRPNLLKWVSSCLHALVFLLFGPTYTLCPSATTWS